MIESDFYKQTNMIASVIEFNAIAEKHFFRLGFFTN